MTIVGEFLLTNLLGYVINLASGERSAAIAATREAKLAEALNKNDVLRKALTSTHSIRDEVRAACIELARNRAQLGIPVHEEPLWRLLSDETFQSDLADWLMAGGIEEGNAVKARILRTIENALANTDATEAQTEFLKTGYFEAVDKTIFSHPVLAHWRHQLSLDYLREQVAVLRQCADEAVGKYSTEKQALALDRYCKKALAAWDIIDLSNLPEGDVQISTQQLLLRQLYMPLRLQFEATTGNEGHDAALARLEAYREAQRHHEAGHFSMFESERQDRKESRSPVGIRLGLSRRLVVLGDPGGGKTTMLRWMATAYLLRHKGDAAFSQIPDTETLPMESWIPVLIRCRDLGEDDLCRCFTDFLTQHLNKTELLPEDSNVMRAVILDRVAKGQALLLVDGLDEITNPEVRMMFCQELERTAARYPDAPIVVTSRIVGYRDMPYRMGSGFEHGVIAELNHKDKDLFARRWIEVTEQHQLPAEKAKRAEELLEALHSSDRIERLTGNPMLLTTLALVKRKVGKLPNRRTKLYAEAVSVLLNWNPRRYQTIEEDEAIPQLEYLAYEMCRRGVQRLTDDEVLDLLDNLRLEYTKVRAVLSRTPRDFLTHLEQRSSILIKSGGIWQKNNPKEKPVWEFRHLTFQEYLAARAILDGRYPARGKPKSLAEQVAPLAGAVEKSKRPLPVRPSDGEADVPESWREALRLLVADCKDDDIDDVILAILNPMAGEDVTKTGRPRAVLAALCLADEPNVSEENAQKVLSIFATKVMQIDGQGSMDTPLIRAAIEVGGSIWSPLLKKSLIQEMCNRTSASSLNVGVVWAMVESTYWKKSGISIVTFLTGLVQRLKSSEQEQVISAALTVGILAYQEEIKLVENLQESLLDVLEQNEGPAKLAASLALGWLSNGSHTGGKPCWKANGNEVKRLIAILDNTSSPQNITRHWLASILGQSKDPAAIQPILKLFEDKDVDVLRAAITASTELGDKKAVTPLLSLLQNEDVQIRRKAIDALVSLGDAQTVLPLLASLNDSDAYVTKIAIRGLGKFGDKQVVDQLLAKLDSEDSSIRVAIIEALVQIGDKRVTAPLLTKFDDEDEQVRKAAIKAMVQFGDKQAGALLLLKLSDKRITVRQEAIEGLGQLADKRAIAPLLSMLEDRSVSVGISSAAALHVLGETRGTAALTRFLSSDNRETRQFVVGSYANFRDRNDQRILSLDFDGRPPWIDPQLPITENQISTASSNLEITSEEVRSRYEAMARDLKLKLVPEK